jgi:hypothetical protein
MSLAPSNISITGVLDEDGRFTSANQPTEVTGQYIFTGSGFGTKTTDPIFENFEGATLGPAGEQIGQIHMSDPVQTITNEYSVSGTKSLKADFSVSAFPGNYIDLTGAADLYACVKQRLEGDPSDANVWKMWRVGTGAVYSGVPHAGESWGAGVDGMPDGYGGEIVTDGGIVTSWAEQNQAVPGAESVYALGAWQFLEIDFKAGTQKAGTCAVVSTVVTRLTGTLFTDFTVGDNILVGNETREIDGITDGDHLTLTASVPNDVDVTFASADSYFKVVADGVETFIWDKRAFGNYPTWVLLPCQGIDGSPDLSVYWDEVYCDESRTRLVFTDNETYADSTRFDVQILGAEAVTDIAIGFDGNTPSFTTGETVHGHYWKDGTHQYLGSKTVVE